jgi:superfamily I DNA/RNA helicase
MKKSTAKRLRREEAAAFRAPGDAATLPELIRFLIDRTGYIKALETEGSPEAFSRIENLKELANAAHDAEVAARPWPSSSTTPPWPPTPTSSTPTPASR